MSATESSKPALFAGKSIRKTLHRGEWWFSIIDFVDALVGGARPRKYWNDLKKKLLAEGPGEVHEAIGQLKIGQLKMRAADGKLYSTDCVDAETLFRVIQAIPSSKVDPLKRWLAQVGLEAAARRLHPVA